MWAKASWHSCSAERCWCAKLISSRKAWEGSRFRVRARQNPVKKSEERLRELPPGAGSGQKIDFVGVKDQDYASVAHDRGPGNAVDVSQVRAQRFDDHFLAFQ